MEWLIRAVFWHPIHFRLRSGTAQTVDETRMRRWRLVGAGNCVVGGQAAFRSSLMSRVPCQLSWLYAFRGARGSFRLAWESVSCAAVQDAQP